jgi:hypothetical protein
MAAPAMTGPKPSQPGQLRTRWMKPGRPSAGFALGAAAFGSGSGAGAPLFQRRGCLAAVVCEEPLAGGAAGGAKASKPVAGAGVQAGAGAGGGGAAGSGGGV